MKKTAPFILVDSDGDGTLDVNQYELESLLVPNWILFKW